MKKPKRVHYLFKKEDQPFCGKRIGLDKSLATRDEDEVTCVSCKKMIKREKIWQSRSKDA